jgi:hypothetical protein
VLSRTHAVVEAPCADRILGIDDRGPRVVDVDPHRRGEVEVHHALVRGDHRGRESGLHERGAHLGDHPAHRGTPVRAEVVTPEHLGERVLAHRPVSFEHQQRQPGRPLDAGKANGPPVPGGYRHVTHQRDPDSARITSASRPTHHLILSRKPLVRPTAAPFAPCSRPPSHTPVG